MTKIKLNNGVLINALEVILEKGVLKITTVENTVEELAELFADKENTNYIVLMTEMGTECGYKVGFTSFVGINYDASGVKTVELMQPANVTEKRLSDAEGNLSMVNKEVSELNTTVNTLLGTEEVENG